MTLKNWTISSGAETVNLLFAVADGKVKFLRQEAISYCAYCYLLLQNLINEKETSYKVDGPQKQIFNKRGSL